MAHMDHDSSQDELRAQAAPHGKNPPAFHVLARGRLLSRHLQAGGNPPPGLLALPGMTDSERDRPHDPRPAAAGSDVRPPRRRVRPFGIGRAGLPRLFQGYLFLGVAGIVLAVFLFTNILVARLANEVKSTSEVFARFCATASYPATTDSTLSHIVGDVIAGLNFPIVLTDSRDTPRAWKGIAVRAEDVPTDELEALSSGRPVKPETRRQIAIVRAAIADMDERHPPIRMVPAAGGEPIGHVHWGDPPGLSQLRWLPYVELVVMLLFVGLAAWGARSIKLSEQRSIWVGMARETAHQLGTPISSMLGWVELLKEQSTDDPKAVETLHDMENDLHRLQKIADRFSKIGSKPDLHDEDLTEVISRVTDYYKRRIPQTGK